MFETDSQSIIAIRGTHSPGDGLMDLNIKTSHLQFRNQTVHVQSGFLKAARAILSHLHEKQLLPPKKPLIITGHSMGGALACILTLLLQKENI